MTKVLGQKVEDDRERAVLLAYQRCLDQDADKFIIEDIADTDELEARLHALVSDVWDPSAYRIRRTVHSGVFMKFQSLPSREFDEIIGEWNGNRRHGIVHVKAIKALRDAKRDGRT